LSGLPGLRPSHKLDSNNAKEVISLPVFRHGTTPSVLQIAILIVITLWATFVDYLRFMLVGSPRGGAGQTFAHQTMAPKQALPKTWRRRRTFTLFTLANFASKVANKYEQSLNPKSGLRGENIGGAFRRDKKNHMAPDNKAN
jgi:hypothetical protein